MLTKSFHISCADGHQMPVYAWLPLGEPVCVLHIAHGMAEYAQRYAPIAEMLVQHGIAVYVHDHRAHGNAVKTEIDLGLPGSNWFYKQVDDIHLAIGYLKKQYPAKKIFLLGHSMGSFICQRYFQMHGNEIGGLILSATNGKQDPLMGFGIILARIQMKMFGNKYRSKLIDKLSFQKFNNAFKPRLLFRILLNKSRLIFITSVCSVVKTVAFLLFGLVGSRSACSPKYLPFVSIANTIVLFS